MQASRILSCTLCVLLCSPAFGQSATATKHADTASTAPLNQRPIRLTGSVIVPNSQVIFVPPSNSSPVMLRNFVAEGSRVKPGDVVLRIESPGGNDLEQLQLAIDQTRSRLDLDVAKLEVAAYQAEKNLVRAKAALAKARVDASLPKLQISALDYDKHQTELAHSLRDLEVKQQAFQEAQGAIARRRQNGELELKKQHMGLAFAKAQLAQSEVLATQSGVMVHGFNPWSGDRYEEGSSGHPGQIAGRILGTGNMQVEAFAIEADRPFLKQDQAVDLSFDALPNTHITGKISQIASAPESIAAWGNGRYFKVLITLPAGHAIPLIAGMSVAIQPLDKVRSKTARTQTLGPELLIEGEIQSRTNIPVSPPGIRQIWKYTLGSLVPEGALVKKGDLIAAFQAPEVASKLETQTSALNEKKRSLEKLKLEQSEADKADDLAVSEAKSNAEKAARKAQVPAELIRRTDYDKFVIERNTSAELAGLSVRERVLQGQARLAERRGLESEIAKLQADINTLNQGIRTMRINAVRDGMVIYRTSFNGEKFASGSEVWNGLSVAMLADPDKLFVSAKVPEAQAASVFIGQKARITIPGANQVVAARVTGLGNVIHSKSQAQPIMVQDVELEFDKPLKEIKPGSAVQASLLLTAKPTPGK
jgi:multidrug resistance efflux pump